VVGELNLTVVWCQLGTYAFFIVSQAQCVRAVQTMDSWRCATEASIAIRGTVLA